MSGEAQLSEVVSRDEIDPDTLLPAWDAKGHITVKQGNTVVAMPPGPEQLRMRLTVMANRLIKLKLKHTGRVELQDITPALFGKYKDYLLALSFHHPTFHGLWQTPQKHP